MTQYKGVLEVLNKKSSGTIAIFDRGDYYKCYGHDAILVANNIFLSEVGLRKTFIDSEEIIYLNINNAQYIKVVKDFLLIFNYRVEVYEEDNGKFFLRAKGTLGNLVDFEDIVSNCVELTEVSTLMSAKLVGNDYNKENHISLCFCNSQDLRIFIAEFNDCAHFPLFEQCVVSLTPRECFLFLSNKELAPNRYKNLEKALERSNILKSEIDLITEDIEICRNQVLKVLKDSFKDFSFNDGIIQILHTLLKRMEIFDDEKYENSFSVANYGSFGYMYVSNSTLNALEIFSLSGDQESTNLSTLSGNVFTLYDHLNRCRSQSGRRIIREWMRRPLFDINRIQERLDVVEALCNQHAIRQALYDDLLRRIPDIGLLSRKLIQKKASLQDCYRLYQLVKLLHRFELEIIELIESTDSKFRSSITELVLEPLRHSYTEFAKFVLLLESTLDIDYCEETGNYRIKPEIDENLTEMAEKIKKLDKKAQHILEKVNSKLDTDSVRLDTNSEYGYFFKITLKSEKLIRNSHLNFKMLDATKGGGIRFTNKALEELNYDFCELHNAYEAGQQELTKAVVTTCGGYVPAMQLLSERLGILDVLTSFAVVASSSSMPYVRPNLLEKGTKVFELIDCRHPVIEQMPNMQFIPNSINLGVSNNDTNTESRFIVLTGANMGGKSTYLRSNALAVFMAQMGCFVACSSARFSLVDGIFTRVGAGDFQSKGVSTFMAEMMDCATILETATENSLIIVDELGRGTSTYDGFGLAWAIAEEIINRIKCFCLFATHFHEMGRLKDVYPKIVENFQVNTLIDENRKLTILYQIIPGVADRSFGLNIAELVGFPKEIIEDAGNVLKLLEGSKSIEV